MRWAVALHPEGVDRNLPMLKYIVLGGESPSTRRAWIEISCSGGATLYFVRVALHPEGVDRNFAKRVHSFAVFVALHPEGVDRNICSP